MNNSSNHLNNMYHSYSSNNEIDKIWYTNYRGYIVKSWLCPETNRIMEEKIPYNQPNNFLHFLDNYFKYKLK